MKQIGLATLLMGLAILNSGCAERRPVVVQRPPIYGEEGEYERHPYYRAPGYRPPLFGERELDD